MAIQEKWFHLIVSCGTMPRFVRREMQNNREKVTHKGFTNVA